MRLVNPADEGSGAVAGLVAVVRCSIPAGRVCGCACFVGALCAPRLDPRVGGGRLLAASWKLVPLEDPRGSGAGATCDAPNADRSGRAPFLRGRPRWWS